MSHEIEIKLRMHDRDALRARLAERGAKRIGERFEVNALFDTDKGTLRGRDCGLRLRAIHPTPPDESQSSTTLTFKGPREANAGGLKQREELEMHIEDAETFAAILARLGYEPRVAFEKRREIWRFGDVEVVLDELPQLGGFVELEGPTSASVLAARDALGLTSAEAVEETYVELAVRAGRVTPSGAIELRFTD